MILIIPMKQYPDKTENSMNHWLNCKWYSIWKSSFVWVTFQQKEVRGANQKGKMCEMGFNLWEN